MRVLHIITDLNGFGGTETTLFRYLRQSHASSAQQKVVVLREIGSSESVGARMVEAGISVTALEQDKGRMTWSAFVALYNFVKDYRPDVISAWLYHPCLLGAIVRMLLPFRCRLVWNIRSLLFCNFRQNPGRYLVQRSLALLRPISCPILATNSPTVIGDHGAIGFPVVEADWNVIPNGLDTTVFRPDPIARAEMRAQLGIASDALVIGCVGRYVPEKGYAFFFEALRGMLEHLDPATLARIHLLAVGNGVSLENPSFRDLAFSKLPAERTHFLGKRPDVPELLRVMDVFVLPSISEAFPNALLEAMATGVACVATDVGGCREALPDPDFLVAPGNATALLEAMLRLVNESIEQRTARGSRNRARVEANYSLSQMAARFDALFGIREIEAPAAIF